jgi:hypothetical protein
MREAAEAATRETEGSESSSGWAKVNTFNTRPVA